MGHGICWWYGTWEEHRIYVVWYVLTVWYGKNTVYDMVRLPYRTMVRYRGCIIGPISPGDIVLFSI